MTDWPGIVRDHGPLVWRVVYRLLSHEADAADCFQRTFLAAVELEAAEPVRNWEAALVRLATARALEQLRTRYRLRGRFVPLSGEPAASGQEAARQVLADEFSDRLRVALTTIDPKQAEVFCQVYLEGRSNQQAAQALGITASYAGVLLQRARAALRQQLEQFDPVQDGAS